MRNTLSRVALVILTILMVCTFFGCKTAELVIMDNQAGYLDSTHTETPQITEQILQTEKPTEKPTTKPTQTVSPSSDISPSPSPTTSLAPDLSFQELC